MVAVLCYVCIILGPDFVLTGGAPPARLPKGGHDWDFIGTFRLTDGAGPPLIARLFTYDSDSVAAKTDGLISYPNIFHLHAMYRVDKGEWKHVQLMTRGRLQFIDARTRAPAEAVLELRPAFRVTLDQLKTAKAEGREINKPFTVTLSAKKGVPVLAE